MNLKIQTVHFAPASSLIELVKRKVEKLPTFESRITDVCVFLKLDNPSHTIKDKVVEVRVHIPRYDFFVKTTSKNFEHSVEDAFASLVSQMKRKKDRVLSTS
ncbi:MAG: HPF/RaiA family ribosome-associated protein [Bacteroidota bacterium]|nr:HPF/RaiA family ribosome-associated protein [Bacteroidota bacterium]